MTCTVPDAGYRSTNKPHPQGEIWIRGPSVTKGYCAFLSLSFSPLSFLLGARLTRSSCLSMKRADKREDLTAESWTEDGWFKTGDVGQWNAVRCRPRPLCSRLFRRSPLQRGR